jgi:hypothetical protein
MNNITDSQSAGGKECEYQFISYDKKKITNLLKKIGQKQIHPRTLYKVVYMYAKDKSGFIRARQEHNKITVTKKKFSKTFPEEYEIELNINSNFNDVVEFVKQIAPKYSVLCITQKYREKWTLPELKIKNNKMFKEYNKCHELVFDEWPGLPTFMEIDCCDETSLNVMIKYLGLNNQKRYTRGAFAIYKILYEIDPKKMFEVDLTFKNVYTILKPIIKTNKNKLKQMQQIYLKSDKYINAINIDF